MLFRSKPPNEQIKQCKETNTLDEKKIKTTHETFVRLIFHLTWRFYNLFKDELHVSESELDKFFDIYIKFLFI